MISEKKPVNSNLKLINRLLVKIIIYSAGGVKSTNSTSKTSVEKGGIVLLPLSPYPSSEGMIRTPVSPLRIYPMPSSQPAITCR